MASSTIEPASFDFLKAISANNNRDWFTANKATYTVAHENMVAFAEALLGEMQTHDLIETASGKKSLMRIYRDTRFSKDKTPYKQHFGGGFRRATQELRGGYYYHIEPGNSFIGCGFWGPSKEDLAHIRAQIAQAPEEFREILAQPGFVKTFGSLEGEQLKTAPKGYPKEHPAIDLLRYKQFLVSTTFTDKQVLSPQFARKVSDTFKEVRPFFDYMSSVLTTDLNGAPLF